MKLAARFPIKDCLTLKWGILLSHLFLLSYGLSLQSHWSLKCLLLGVCLFSYVVSIKAYFKLTRASDDLCWSGEHWTMMGKQIEYLTIRPSSWLTGFAAILHFEQNDRMHYWLFTRKQLGDRAFSELIYLAKLSIQTTTIPNQ